MGQTNFSTPAKLVLGPAPVKTYTILFAFFFLSLAHARIKRCWRNGAQKKSTAVEMFLRNKAELKKLLLSSVPSAAQLKRIEALKTAIKKFMDKANLPAQAPRCIYTPDDIIRFVMLGLIRISTTTKN